MIQPAGEKKSTEQSTSSSSTHVQKGKFTIDMYPKQTVSIHNTDSVFSNWLTYFPVMIAAQFAGIPTNFPGIEYDDVRTAQVHKESS